MNSPRKLLLEWVDLFNEADAQGLAELYHEDAVNHQVAKDQVIGREAIQKMFEAEFSEANMVCIVENIFEDKEWGILEWKDPLGLRGSGFFQISDGKIKFQRGYWDRLTFLKVHNLPIPN